MSTIHEAIKKASEDSENIESYTKYSILVVEEGQVFVQFDGVPKRGTLCMWVKTPTDLPYDEIVYAEEEEEPRTVAFLRNEIDDLDYNIMLAKKALKEEEHKAGASSAAPYMLTFMKLTITNAEDLRRRLFEELEDLF